MDRLRGKRAVITGGTSGIGLATAEIFREEGARVLVTGRDQQRLAAVRGKLADVRAVRADAASIADLHGLAREIEDYFGQFEVLFVNAGEAQFLPFEDTDEEIFDRLFNVNFKGAFFTVQRLLPLMCEGGAVIFNTSVSSRVGMRSLSAYAASKAALSSLVASLAAELSTRRIRVNAVCPGPFETSMHDKLRVSAEEAQRIARSWLTRVPLRRFGRAEEAARVALFLASDEASFICGQELVVDGGMSAVF